jgi:hypothetical protein
MHIAPTTTNFNRWNESLTTRSETQYSQGSGVMTKQFPNDFQDKQKRKGETAADLSTVLPEPCKYLTTTGADYVIARKQFLLQIAE